MPSLPRLTTNRLLLRPLQASDAEGLCAVITNSRTYFARWFIWAESSTLDSVRENLRQAEEVMALGSAWHYAICHPVSETILGRIGFADIDNVRQSAELGYWLRSGYENKGVMTEALSALLQYAFGPGDLHRIVAYTDVENVASQRVLEKLGFQREGIRPSLICHPVRGWRDHYAYGLTGSSPKITP